MDTALTNPDKMEKSRIIKQSYDFQRGYEVGRLDQKNKDKESDWGRSLLMILGTVFLTA